MSTHGPIVSLLALFALGSLPACFLGDDDSTTHSSASPSTRSGAPAPPCAASRPQILGLDMAPSAQISSAGDYEIVGTIRYSCSGVSVQAHVLSPDGYVRWAPEPSSTPGEPARLSLRFAGSQKGQTVQYEISVLQSAALE